MALMTVALLAAAIPAAYGQDATPAARQSANPSAPAQPPGGASTNGTNGSPSAGPPTATGAPTVAGPKTTAGPQTAQGTPTATGTQASAAASQAGDGQQANGSAAESRQPNGADKTAKSPPVCFKLTGHCVEGSKAPAAKGGAASAPKNGSKQPALNLTAPDVQTVVSADELKEPLPSNEQITEVQEADTVSIKGEGVPTDVPVGFGAIWWALNHPSQAWRIVTPYE